MKLDSLIEAPADIADASTPIREAADQDMEAFLTDSIDEVPQVQRPL